MTTFVPFFDDGGTDPTAAIIGSSSSSPSPPPPDQGKAGKVGKADSNKGRSSSVVTWEEAHSQLTDDRSCYDNDCLSSGSSYYTTTDESADLSGDLDDLRRTFTEALQLIGVGTPVRRESSPSEADKTKKTKTRQTTTKKAKESSSSRRRRGEMSDRHGRRRRKHKRHGSNNNNNNKNDKTDRKDRGSVAGSPVRSTPSRPRVRTPSASIMKKKPSSSSGSGNRDVSSTNDNGGPPPPPPPPPQVPTLVEWSEAYGIDRELQVVKILVQNDRAKEAYVWQLDHAAPKNKRAEEEEEEEEEKKMKTTDGSTRSGAATDADDDDDATTLRLSLHDELLANRLRYDARDSMLYLVEEVPVPQPRSPSGDARLALVPSSSATAVAAPAPTIDQPTRTNRLRIVPQTLRRRLFNVALHQTGTASNSASANATTTTTTISTTAFSVFHRLRSSYYWAGMYHDVHRWWADCERMVLAAEAGEMAAVARSAPGTPTKKAGPGGGGRGSGRNAAEESPYRVPNELRVTFSRDNNTDDADTTVDTCLDMTMDTDDGMMLMMTPPSSPGKRQTGLVGRFKTPSPLRKKANHKPDPPGSTASLSSTVSASKTKKILQKAVTRLSPSKISPSTSRQSKSLATVEYTQVVPSGDGSIVSAASRASPPTNLSDAPTLVRRTSFVSLLRSKSRDVDEDAGQNVAGDSSAAGPQSQQPRLGSSLPPPLSPRASSIRAAAGLPPTSPGSTTAPSSSSSTLKKSESVESFSKRFKGIGKKIAGGSKEGRVCTVTPVVRAPSADNVERCRSTGRSSSSLSAISATQADMEPMVAAADIGDQKELQPHQKEEEEEEGITAACSNGAGASFFSVANMESASEQFVAFLDTFADSLCKDGTSDDESQVWQRAVPTVIGLGASKNA